MSTRLRKEPMVVVRDVAEIPAFTSQAEEAAYWSTHAMGEELFDDTPDALAAILPPPRQVVRSISVRFDDDTLQCLKHLARLKRKGYHALLKEFVVERLYEEEKRTSVFGK